MPLNNIAWTRATEVEAPRVPVPFHAQMSPTATAGVLDAAAASFGAALPINLPLAGLEVSLSPAAPTPAYISITLENSEAVESFREFTLNPGGSYEIDSHGDQLEELFLLKSINVLITEYADASTEGTYHLIAQGATYAA